jgi:hypothetical protein
MRASLPWGIFGDLHRNEGTVLTPRRIPGTAARRRPWAALSTGLLLLVGPLLPYDGQGGHTVSEADIMVWPSPVYLCGLGLTVAALAVVAIAMADRKPAVRRWCAGALIPPAVTALTVHTECAASLLYRTDGRGLPAGPGAWCLSAAALLSCALGPALLRILVAPEPWGRLAAPAPPSTPWVAVVLCGGLLQQWFIDPLAVTGRGFVPYGMSAPVSDAYGALAYVTTGPVLPQAVAGCGLALVLGLTVVAAGLPGPTAAGVVAGAAATASVDVIARLLELVHPAHSVAVRWLPFGATLGFALLLLVIAFARTRPPHGAPHPRQDAPDSPEATLSGPARAR